MKSHARVVIVGGGAMGVGLLYHLALEGWRDVVLVEKGELTSGSTWHAATVSTLQRFAEHVARAPLQHKLYARLEKLTGHSVSWHGCGGLRLATTDEEVLWLKHVHGISTLAGYEAHVIGHDEIARAITRIWIPRALRRRFSPSLTATCRRATLPTRWRRAARKLGAEVYRRTRATDIRLLASGEWQVVTDQGNISCEHVVNSAGSYANVVGAWTGHNVPLVNMLHHYVITEPLQELIDLENGTSGGARSIRTRVFARGDQWHSDRPRRNSHRPCVLGRQATGLEFRERADCPGT